MLRDDGQVRCVACMMCPTSVRPIASPSSPRKRPTAGSRSGPKISRSTSSLRGLRALRRGLPLRRHPDGHARPRQADLPARRRDPRQRRADVARDRLSSATQGGVGAFWREKVKGAPQTPPAGDVVAGRLAPGPDSSRIRDGFSPLISPNEGD